MALLPIIQSGVRSPTESAEAIPQLLSGVRTPAASSVTPQLEKFVSAKVESGRYNSARAAQLAEFNEELGRRLAALDRGEAVDPAEARARLRRKSEQRRKPRA
jgi:Arc/MetJ-type ribon-helix-helix transcriptional regulator